MATSAVVRQTGPRVRALGVIWLAIGIALLGGAAAAIYFSGDASRLRAYNSAPLCASLDDAVAGKDCRYTTTATITDFVGEGNATDIDVRLPSMYGLGYRATVPSVIEPDTSFAVGSQVPVELWMYHVTKIANLTTADNPVNDPRPRSLQEIAALLAVLGAGGVLMARRVWRDDSGEASIAATMSPVATSDLLTH